MMTDPDVNVLAVLSLDEVVLVLSALRERAIKADTYEEKREVEDLVSRLELLAERPIRGKP